MFQNNQLNVISSCLNRRNSKLDAGFITSLSSQRGFLSPAHDLFLHMTKWSQTSNIQAGHCVVFVDSAHLCKALVTLLILK